MTGATVFILHTSFVYVNSIFEKNLVDSLKFYFLRL